MFLFAKGARLASSDWLGSKQSSPYLVRLSSFEPLVAEAGSPFVWSEYSSSLDVPPAYLSFFERPHGETLDKSGLAGDLVTKDLVTKEAFESFNIAETA